jgi:hypothetical protein
METNDKKDILFYPNVAVHTVVASIDSIQFLYTNCKCPIIVNMIHKYLVIANFSCIKIMDFLGES